MWDILPASMRNFIDSIFQPAMTFLNMMIDYLGRIGAIAGKGISLNNYFSFFGYLPPSWQVAVKSALSCVTMLGILFIVKVIWDSYLKYKASGKWW